MFVYNREYNPSGDARPSQDLSSPSGVTEARDVNMSGIYMPQNDGIIEIEVQ
jgi:hypothetical protein